MILGRKGIQQAQELARIDPKGGVIDQSRAAENRSQGCPPASTPNNVRALLDTELGEEKTADGA
jgi:hypothetical protein